MSHRINIPAKLALAAAPLVLALGVLLTSTVSSTMNRRDVQNHAADVVRVWNVALNLMEDIKTEQLLFTGAAIGDVAGTRAQTDEGRAALEDAIAAIGTPGQLEAARRAFTSKLLESRVNADNPDVAAKPLAIAGFGETINNLDEITGLLPPEAGDKGVGQALQALSSNSRMVLDLEELRDLVVVARQTGTFQSALASTKVNEVYTNLDRFKAGASTNMIEQWTAGGYDTKVSTILGAVITLADTSPEGVQPAAVAFDLATFDATLAELSAARAQFVTSEISNQNNRAASTERSVIFKMLFPVLACCLALVLAYRMVQSITNRIRLLTAKATEVSEVELPKLVAALRDPSGKAPLPEVVPIEGAGTDEIGDLAESFTAVQTTLVSVAAEQMTVLRRGVSDIFVTLARRNRSLVDSQLNLLDRLEAEVEDPRTLADYYKIDHLATRMRRNTESLLVLANSDSRRRSSAALGVDDVVRAAISEVEDYRRIEVQRMETLAVKGPVVADISHLLAELLDNATTFSSPTSTVRVAGDLTTDGYLISISDEGVGMAHDRLEALNTLLANPPIIGLSVEPTLGLSVVSLLAHKHGVAVSLVAAGPGLRANVVIPADLYDRRSNSDNDANFIADAAFNASIGVDDVFRASMPDGPAFDAPLVASELAATPIKAPVVAESPVFEAPALNKAPAFDEAPRFDESPVATFAAPPTPPPPPPAFQPPPPPFSPAGLSDPAPAVQPTEFAASTAFAAPIPSAPIPAVSSDQGPIFEMNAPISTSFQATLTREQEAFTALAVEPIVFTSPLPRLLPRRSRSKARAQADVANAQGAPGLSADQLALLSAVAAPPAPALEMDIPEEPAYEAPRTNAAGLPVRIPGRAKPKTGEDDRTSGTTQPTKVRSSLSAYSRGAAAAKGTHGFSNSGIDHFGPIDPTSPGSR